MSKHKKHPKQSGTFLRYFGRTLLTLYDVETRLLDNLEFDCSSWKEDGPACMERSRRIRELVISCLLRGNDSTGGLEQLLFRNSGWKRQKRFFQFFFSLFMAYVENLPSL